MSNMTVIEINGVKMEVDLRQARRVDSLQVGDRVKVLTKQYDGYKVNAGTVIGFEPFEALPTIIIAYLETSYSSVGVKFIYFNAQSKEIEIVKSIDDDQLDIDKAGVMAQFQTEIAKKEIELEDIKKKRDYFAANFKAYWEGVGVTAE
jgi:hypothetical protein